MTLTPKLWSTARPAKVAMRISSDFRATGSRGRLVLSRLKAWNRMIASKDSMTRRIVQVIAMISRRSAPEHRVRGSRSRRH